MVGDTKDHRIKKYDIDRLYCEMVVAEKNEPEGNPD
jgi:hypothetical protein